MSISVMGFLLKLGAGRFKHSGLMLDKDILEEFLALHERLE
jgi:hypothetical protein